MVIHVYNLQTMVYYMVHVYIYMDFYKTASIAGQVQVCHWHNYPAQCYMYMYMHIDTDCQAFCYNNLNVEYDAEVSNYQIAFKYFFNFNLYTYIQKHIIYIQQLKREVSSESVRMVLYIFRFFNNELVFIFSFTFVFLNYFMLSANRIGMKLIFTFVT